MNRFSREKFNFLFASGDEENLRQELKDHTGEEYIGGKLLTNLLNDHGCTLEDFVSEGGQVIDDKVEIDKVMDWLGY